MKKISLLLIVITTVVLFLLQGCGKKELPNGPYDATPTPCPQLWLSINVKDINVSGTPVSVDRLTVTAKSRDVIKVGQTNSDGTVNLEVFGYGEHLITIPGSMNFGFPGDLTYTVNINNTFTTYNIIRGNPSFTFGIQPGYNTTYTYLTTTVRYDITYHTDTKKYCYLTLEGLSNTRVMYAFNPPFVENNGDKSVLTITTPKYLDAGGIASKVTYTVKGLYTDRSVTIGYDELIQNWDFNPALIGNFVNTASGENYLDFSIILPGNSMNAPISNVKIKIPAEKIKVLRSLYDPPGYDGYGDWYPHSWTDQAWSIAIGNPSNTWFQYSFEGSSPSTTGNFYVYPNFKNLVFGNIIYHSSGTTGINTRCTRVTFVFYNDEGFYRECTLELCKP